MSDDARAGSGSEGPTGEDAHLVQTVVGERMVYQGSHLSLRVLTVADNDGERHALEIVGHPGAVAVLALDGDDLLFVRQYRMAAGEVLLEIPAGTLDRGPDGTTEPSDDAAARELAEETGMRAREWRRLGTFWTAPGFATEKMHLYLAQDLEPVADYAGPPPGERLDLVRIPWREAVAMAERGEFRDAKSLTGVFWLARLLDQPSRASASR